MENLYLLLAGQQTGPHSPDQARQLIASGQVSAVTLAWHPGLTEWKPLGQLAPELCGGMPPPPPPMPPIPPPRKGLHPGVIAAIVVVACFLGLFVLSCLAGIALGPITRGIQQAKESGAMQQARAIGLAMFAYANDHNGQYPDGKTSTEVFQKLLDGKYVGDPGMFYISMPGKMKATTAQLTAENVCFDVTSGVTGSSSDVVPLVFSTGYSISYGPTITATRDSSQSRLPFRGIVVAIKNNSARAFRSSTVDDREPIVLSTSVSDGKVYEQLRP